MRAYVVEEPGGAFKAVELPRSVPAAGQVLMRVHASGVNPLDTKIRAGKAGHAQQPPWEILREAANLVDEGKLRPLLNEKRFTGASIADAHAMAEAGALGKVDVEL